MSVLILLLLPHLFSFESDISNDTNKVKYIHNEITKLIVNMSKNSVPLPELQSLEKEVKDFVKLVIQKNPEYSSMPIKSDENGDWLRFNNKGEKDTTGFGYATIAKLSDAISALKLHIELLNNYDIQLFDFSKIRSITSLLAKLTNPDTFKKIPNEYKHEKGWNNLTKFTDFYFGRELFTNLKSLNSDRITLVQNRITQLIMNMSNKLVTLSELQSLEKKVKDFVQLVIQKNPGYSSMPIKSDKNGDWPRFNNKGEKDTTGFGYATIAKLSDAISALKLHIELLNNYDIQLFDFSKIRSIKSLLEKLKSHDTFNKIPNEYKQEKGWSYLNKFSAFYFGRELFYKLKDLNNNWLTLIQERITKLITDMSKNLVTLSELQPLEKVIEDFTQLVIQKNPEYSSMPIKSDKNGDWPRFNNKGEKDTTGFGYITIARLSDAISALKLHIELLNNYDIQLFDFSKIRNIKSLLEKLKSHDTFNKIPNEYKQEKGWSYLNKFSAFYFGRELFYKLKDLNNNWLTLIQERITKLITDMSKNLVTLSELQPLEKMIEDFTQLVIQKNPEYFSIPVSPDKTGRSPKFNDKGEKDTTGFGYIAIAKLSDAISTLKLHIELLNNYNIQLFDFSKIKNTSSLLEKLRSRDTFKKIPKEYLIHKGWIGFDHFTIHFFTIRLFKNIKTNSNLLNNEEFLSLIKDLKSTNFEDNEILDTLMKVYLKEFATFDLYSNIPLLIDIIKDTKSIATDGIIIKPFITNLSKRNIDLEKRPDLKAFYQQNLISIIRKKVKNIELFQEESINVIMQSSLTTENKQFLIDQINKAIDNIQRNNAIYVPNITKTLEPYQKDGVSFLINDDNKILADQMGLGKTIISIAAINYLGIDKIIWVTTNTSLETVKSELLQTEKELKKEDIYIVNPKYKKLLGKRQERFKNAKYILISYDLLSSWHGKNNIDIYNALKSTNYDLLILDEGHLVDKHASNRYDEVTQILPQAARTWVLTASLYQSNPKRLFNILNLLWPNFFTNRKQFEDLFIENPNGALLFKSVLDTTKLLRRTKTEIISEFEDETVISFEEQLENGAKVPKLEIKKNPLLFDITDEQKAAYHLALEDYTTFKELFSIENPKLLGPKADSFIFKLSVFNKIIYEPLLLGLEKNSGLNDAIVSWVKSKLSKGEQVGVWHENISVLKSIEKAIKEAGIKDSVMIYGKNSTIKERQTILEKFNNGETKVLISSFLLAEGQNLPAMTSMLIAKIPNRFSILDQMTGRMNRMITKERIKFAKTLTTVEFLIPNIATNNIMQRFLDRLMVYGDFFEILMNGGLIDSKYIDQNQEQIFNELEAKAKQEATNKNTSGVDSKSDISLFPKHYFVIELLNKLKSVKPDLKRSIKESNNTNGITPIQKRMLELITNMSKKEDPTANLYELQELIRNELEAIDKNTSDIDSKSDISLIETLSTESISNHCKNSIKLMLHSI